MLEMDGRSRAEQHISILALGAKIEETTALIRDDGLMASLSNLAASITALYSVQLPSSLAPTRRLCLYTVALASQVSIPPPVLLQVLKLGIRSQKVAEAMTWSKSMALAKFSTKGGVYNPDLPESARHIGDKQDRD